MSVVGVVAGIAVTGALLHHNATRPSTPSTWMQTALDDNSSVALPPGATHDAKVMPVGTGSLTIDTWTAHSGSYDYSVARTPIAQSLNDTERMAMFRGAANGAFAAVHVNAPQLTQTSIAGSPTLRGVGTASNETVQGAFVYTHGALYELLVAGPHAQASDLDALVAGFSTRG